VFASLNRYERKKRIDLAVQAFAALDREISDRAVLVIAGGYDSDVRENVEHLQELQALVEQANLTDRVIFRRSISDAERVALIKAAAAILYTPDREHFGIVPIEAMFCETPVIAVASGGPLETVVHEKTGFLCDQTPQAFAEAMTRIVLDPQLSPRMGAQGKKRVEQLFTLSSFATALEDQIYQTFARTQGERVREFALNAAIISTASTMLASLVLSIFVFVLARKCLTIA
jgi:glycosyltransferase involved in cell wall biosynthesis